MNKLKESYQTDAQLKKRVEMLSKYFKKDNKYIDFEGFYCLSINERDNSKGIRWFHRNKYIVEVVVNARHFENGPHINIAHFVLFSNYNDAILHMALKEREAAQIIEDAEKRIN